MSKGILQSMRAYTPNVLLLLWGRHLQQDYKKIDIETLAEVHRKLGVEITWMKMKIEHLLSKQEMLEILIKDYKEHNYNE